MELLVTGRIQPLSKTFFDPLSIHHKVIVAAKNIDTKIIGKTVKSYHCSPIENEFSRLFQTHSIEGVLYFVEDPVDIEESSLDFSELVKVLDTCVVNKVQKIILASSTYIYHNIDQPTEESQPYTNSRKGNILLGYERICEMYRENYDLEITVVHAPQLFGEYDRHSFIGKILYQIHEGGDVVIDGRPEQIIDFLSQKDFFQIIDRIFLEENKFPIINLPGATNLSLQGLYTLLDEYTPEQRLSFSEEELIVGPPVQSNIAEKYYKWQTTTSIEDELAVMLEAMKIHKVTKRKTKWRQLTESYQQNAFLLMLLELVIGFMIMEYLNRVSSVLVQFNMIDFRLLFVVLFTAIHGRTAGILAAILASVSMFRSYQATGIDWRIVFYQVENWLPFAGYLVTAFILGYIRERKEIEVVDSENENTYLSEKYSLLDDLYETAVLNKEQYKKQIINYRDSFGRIFDIISRLDKVNPEEIFEESLVALEEFLENESIAIYSFSDDAREAQLTISSKAIAAEVRQTLDLQQYPHLLKEIGENQVWINKEQREQYPDYVFSIYKDQKPIILICVQEASFEQMTLSYTNNFKIICNIIDFSLLHAWKNQGQQEEPVTKNKMILMNQYLEKQQTVSNQKLSKDERSETND